MGGTTVGKLDSISAFFIIIGAFVAGYWIVSKLFQKLSASKAGEAGGRNAGNSSWSEAGSRYSHEAAQERLRYADRAAYYSELMELRGDHSADNIKKRYRELIAQYHPDKVHHLGREFSAIADKKTREINEAYEYFKQRYNIN